MRASNKKANSAEQRRLRSESPAWQREWRRMRIMKAVFTTSIVILAAVILLAFWLVWVYEPTPTPRPEPELWDWEEIIKLQEAGGRALGELVRERHPEGSVVVLTPPEPARDDIDSATLEGVLAGLKYEQDSELVIIQEIGGEQKNEKAADVFFGLDAESFDKAVEPHMEAAAVISIVGLPTNPEKMRFWPRRPRPELMLINAEIFRLGRIIRQGGIEAVATRHPAVSADSFPEDPDELKEFWLIITEDNVEELKERHPNLFVREHLDQLNKE